MEGCIQETRRIRDHDKVSLHPRRRKGIARRMLGTVERSVLLGFGAISSSTEASILTASVHSIDLDAVADSCINVKCAERA